ncbi:replication protein RepA [Paracraurococcus ruber]
MPVQAKLLIRREKRSCPEDSGDQTNSDLVFSNSLITRVLRDKIGTVVPVSTPLETESSARVGMGTVHDLLEAKGKQGALALDLDRAIVDAAAAYLADEDQAVGYLFSGWTQAALPHKRLADDQVWEIRTERVTLLVEPGRKPNPLPGLPHINVGVPYGSRARLIMLYLQTEALKTNSREIELGRSLRAWFSRLGIAPGGKSIRDVREQAERISRCRLSFHLAASGGNPGGLKNQNIVDDALFLDTHDPDQGSLFLEKAKLSESFFEQLKKHPVPIEEAAIRVISNNSMALDIYCWLSYRLHVLKAPTPVSWAALKIQFGAGFGKLAHFKHKFLPNLALAQAVYRDAKVEVDERGLILRPSRPPVAPRQVAAR